MTDFSEYNLFPTKILKCKVDPLLYKKENIVKEVLENYKKDKNRNNWDKKSQLHHYLNDWENTNFNKLNLNSLSLVYGKIISDHINKITFNSKITYEYSIENISVNTRFMKEHDHFGSLSGIGKNTTMFGCIHYIKFDKSKHTKTTFINPLHFAYYNSFLEFIQSKLDHTDTNNSNYFSYWEFDVEEDDFFIFPSYLKHIVYDNYLELEENNPRIISSVNIRITDY